MDNLKNMGKFLDMYNLLRHNQEETENMNSSIISHKIESVIIKIKLPTNKNSGREGFTGEFYQTFREQCTTIPLKLLQKSAEEGVPPNVFCEASITLIVDHNKDTTIRKIQANITEEYRCKNFNKMLANKIL